MFHPYESWGKDFDRDFIERARFTCTACRKECSLKDGSMQAEGDQMFAFGKCSECGKDLKYDVTREWREE